MELEKQELSIRDASFITYIYHVRTHKLKPSWVPRWRPPSFSGLLHTTNNASRKNIYLNKDSPSRRQIQSSMIDHPTSLLQLVSEASFPAKCCFLKSPTNENHFKTTSESSKKILKISIVVVSKSA